MRALAALALLALAGCDLIAETTAVRPEEGQSVTVVADAAALPTSRAGYAGLSAFVVAGGPVVLLDPGTGTADPPRFVRVFDMPWGSVATAQLDADGYLWLASPSVRTAIESASNDRVVVLDPHTARVHRVLALPAGRRTPLDLIVAGERVIVRSWESSEPAALLVAETACARDAARCQVREWADVGAAVAWPQSSLRVSGDTLATVSAEYLVNDPSWLDLWRLSTGERIARVDSVGRDALFTPDALIDLRWRDGRREWVRLDRQTLAVTARAAGVGGSGTSESFVTRQGDRLYAARQDQTTVVVRDARTLAVVETLDTGSVATAVFGFVAPDVLLLNGRTAYDVAARRPLADVSPLSETDYAETLRAGAR